MHKLLLGCIVFIFSCTQIHAAVVINEVSPRSDPEWVELYNTGPEIIDFTDWYLVDLKDNKESLTSLGLVQPNNYIVFSRPKGWLNDTTEESLSLYSPNYTSSIDALSYTTINENMSVARIPDITGTWFTNQICTQGISNDISPSPSPSSSVSPSPLSSPVAAQTPTPSPSPSPSPTSQSTQTPTPSPSPTKTPSPSVVLKVETWSPPPGGTVAGEMTEIDLSGFGVTPTPVGEPTLQGQSLPAQAGSQAPKLNKSRAQTAIIIGSGLILIALASYFGYRKYLRLKGSDLKG